MGLTGSLDGVPASPFEAFLSSMESEIMRAETTRRGVAPMSERSPDKDSTFGAQRDSVCTFPCSSITSTVSFSGTRLNSLSRVDLGPFPSFT